MMLKSFIIFATMMTLMIFVWALLYMTSTGPTMIIMMSTFIMCNQLSLISWLIILLWGGSILLVMVVSCTMGMMDYFVSHGLFMIFAITSMGVFTKWQNVFNSYNMINSSAMIYCMMIITMTCVCISIIKNK